MWTWQCDSGWAAAHEAWAGSSVRPAGGRNRCRLGLQAAIWASWAKVGFRLEAFTKKWCIPFGF